MHGFRAALVGGSLILCVGQARAEPGATSAEFAGSVVLGRDQPAHAVDVVAIGWGMRYRDETLDFNEGLGALGLRARPTEGLWVEAGAGAASTRADAASRVVPAGMFGLGVALAPLGLPLELSMHVGSGVETDGTPCGYHASMGVGGTW